MMRRFIFTFVAATSLLMFSSSTEEEPILVYKCLISQIGLEDPTVHMLGPNTIGDISWNRINPGFYIGTLSGAFPLFKTFIMINSGHQIRFTHVNPNQVVLETIGWSGTPYDGVLNHTSLEILVFS